MITVRIDDAEFQVLEPDTLHRAASIVRFQKNGGQFPIRLDALDHVRVMREYERLQDERTGDNS